MIDDAEIEAARRRGEEAARTEPRAASARYDTQSGKVIVDLVNGGAFAFPARALQGLDTARARRTSRPWR